MEALRPQIKLFFSINVCILPSLGCGKNEIKVTLSFHGCPEADLSFLSINDLDPSGLVSTSARCCFR